MGNNFQHRQKTWKICMVCNRRKKLNEDLMLLNSIFNKEYTRTELILRCSEGHILLYEGPNDHIHEVKKCVTNRETAKSEINKLKQENSLLKKEITFLKNNHEPSAPPLLDVALVEAVVIK